MTLISPSSSFVRIGFFAVILVMATVPISNAEDCPPCYYNQVRPNTTGNGTAPDGRPILEVQIDSSWNVNNAGQPQSGTNSNIYNGVTGCPTCIPREGAAGMWNSAQGTGGFGINFHVQLNQGTSTPNIIISRDDTIDQCANINLAPPGGPYTIRLRTGTSNMELWGIVERIAHEIGHGIGLANVTNVECGQEGIMSPSNPNCASNVGRTVTATDVNQSRKAMDSGTAVTCEAYVPPEIPEPTPTPTPPPEPEPCPDFCPSLQTYPEYYCFGPVDFCTYGGNGGCEPGSVPVNRCCCQPITPIIIDVLGDGFAMSGPESGVNFDFIGNGQPLHLSWTAIGSDDAFLVLDRNGNHAVDDGSELFGNRSPQTNVPGVQRNGFRALAEFDKPENGGNNDGSIGVDDSVFLSLQLWQDNNRDGISEPSELRGLPQFGIASLDLDHKESKRTDEYGNKFRYRAKVKDMHGFRLGRWMWDVFLRRVL